ncbi:hypothetical protein [Rhodococcus sp. 21391]|uniref:hypothetical protein n=1 Tax=Rhodococcus sp. 21391 TaxID=2683591 RepID=UPI001ED92C03|nr:hypothetical protein [Rhodococcus sp. 21391]
MVHIATIATHDEAARPNLTVFKRALSLSFNLGHRVGQLVMMLFGVSPRHGATTA